MDPLHRTRLENVLAMNKPLAIAYYLKEDLRLFWQQTSKEKAGVVFEEVARTSRRFGGSVR